MKKILFGLFLCISSSAFSADMIMPVRGVYDGDTIRSTVKLPCPLCNVSLRIRGIDTPESTHLAKCEKERVLGVKAKEYMTKLLENQQTIMARDIRWDKYGGRIDANLELNGKDLGKEMIALGFAKPYTGQGAKPDWCN